MMDIEYSVITSDVIKSFDNKVEHLAQGHNTYPLVRLELTLPVEPLQSS